MIKGKTISTALLVFFLITVSSNLFAKKDRRSLPATRIEGAPIFDGNLGDPNWNYAKVATDFFQYEPHNDRAATKKTEVRILYNDNSIFIGAFLHDLRPDSILKELGLRDSGHRLNSDQFWVDINPFNDGLNSYRFKVSSSGVQTDISFSVGSSDHGDPNWDAVWRSNVSITNNGWIVEMEIPYSALRIPSLPNQGWGINFWREVRRSRESSSWNFVDRTYENLLASKGVLTHIEGIKTPVRLSLFPYITTYLENNELNKNWRGLINGGLDLKYGLNKSFTLDLALIPDFGQVKSDDQVLNLSPFEIRFDENRQFFTEGVDLFSKADLFYSRRIGSRPRGRALVAPNLQENEQIKENPFETRLLNATKISGRTSKGLGLGIFNAITAPANAIIIDTLTNNERSITTQPLTNYNLIVLDQGLANNSSISLINTNVWGSISGYVANVTGTEFQINDSSNRFRISGSGAISQQYYSGQDNVIGFKGFVSFAKTGGTWQYRYEKQLIDGNYEQNDLGFLRRNNQKTDELSISYNMFNPSPGVINRSLGLSGEYARLYETSAFTDLDLSVNFRTLFMSRLFYGVVVSVEPLGTHDYFEPRTPGRFYHEDPEVMARAFVSTDHRRMVFAHGNISYRKSFSNLNRNRFSINIMPTVRFSDRFNVAYMFEHSINHNDIGFATKTTNNDVIFGLRRNVITTNRISGNYMVNNSLSLDVQLRHYWSTVKYSGDYFVLGTEGKLDPWDFPVANDDINFNALTVDSRIIWNFAPGSQLSLVWKNSIESRNSSIPASFFENLEKTLGDPQINSISLRLLYYIDYQTIKRLIGG